MTELIYGTVAHEPLKAVLPSDDPLAASNHIAVAGLVSQLRSRVCNTTAVLRAAVGAYLRTAGLDIALAHTADDLAVAISRHDLAIS